MSVIQIHTLCFVILCLVSKESAVSIWLMRYNFGSSSYITNVRPGWIAWMKIS